MPILIDTTLAILTSGTVVDLYVIVRRLSWLDSVLFFSKAWSCYWDDYISL